MTLNQLKYALYLNKYRNFRKAAEKLEISQPALSYQIKKLEKSLGIQLFNRSVSPIVTTEDGEIFLVKAQEIIASTKKLESFAAELTEDFTGKLEIGVIPTLSPFLVPLFSKALSRDYPDLQLIFKEQITETIVNDVRNGDLDVGIISTPIHVSGITSIPLFYERFYVYASRDYYADSDQIELDDINYEELWLLDEGNCFRDQINNFCDHRAIQKGKKFIYQCNSIDALIRIVDSRGGITILPELTTLSLNSYQEESLKTICGQPRAREIGLIMTPNYNKARYIRVLEEYILSNIPQHMTACQDYEIVDPNISIR